MIKRFFQKYFINSFFLNVPLVVNTVIALVTQPIILANLPVEDYGKLQLVLALQVWFIAFSAPQITLASKRGIAKGLDGTFLYGFIARLKLLIPIGLIIIFTAGILKFLNYFTFSTLLVILGFYLIFGVLSQRSFHEFLIAKKKFKEWSYWQILISSLPAVGSAFVAYFTKDIIYFASFRLGGMVILSWVGWFWIVKKENLIGSYKRREIDKECVPYGLKLIPIDLVFITAKKISYFIIGPFFGFANLAIFSVADNLRDKCTLILKSAYPLLFADFAKIEWKELTKIISRYLIKIGFSGFLLAFGFIGLAWFYIKFFLPETFHPAILYFTILSLGLPAAILEIILNTILESHLRYKELTVVGLVPNLIKIILILVFGYFWQIIGICIAFVIGLWIDFGFYYFLTLKEEVVIKVIHKYPYLEKLAKRY